jgi:AcrR family transcriptional regulator
LSGRSAPDDPKERTRRRIIDAATELFIARGYKRASVDEIAARAGVAKGTLYAYAKNKATLLALALIEEKLSHIESLAPVFDETRPGHERLKQVVYTWLVLGEQWPLTARVMERDREFLFALTEVDERFRIPEAGNRTELYEKLIEAAAPGRYTNEEKRERAQAVIALGFSAVILRDPLVRQGLSLERAADLISDMVVNGLARTPTDE